MVAQTHAAPPDPRPLVKGAAGERYPFAWSVYRRLDGETATTGTIAGLHRFATELTGFLRALYRIDPAGGPLTVYDTETRLETAD